MIQDARLLTNNFWYVKNSQPIVYLTLGKTPEPVYGGMLDKIGAGGLETAYIQFAEALARRKCTVFMFSHCAEPHCHKGVYYVPFEQINEYILDVSPDILITSRWFDTLYLETGTVTKRIIWLHDAHFADPEKPDAFSKADMVVCSSSWHRNYIAERYGEGIAAKKIRIIPLSIDKTFFEEIPPKNANRMLYSSNPDRGLMTLLRMWKTIREQAGQPELFLTVTYGWEGLETWGGSEEWKKHTLETKEQTIRLANEAGRVEFTGRLNKKDLYGIIKNSTLCLYPNNFQETFCCHPDNEIFTACGYKKIIDLSLSDTVLTHTGKFKPIRTLMSRPYAGTLYGLYMQNNRHAISFFTEQHKMLAISKKDMQQYKGVLYNQQYSKKHLDIEPVWTEINKLSVGDYVCSPSAQFVQEPEQQLDMLQELSKLNRNYKDVNGRVTSKTGRVGIPRYISLDLDFARFLGLYLSEGSYSGSAISFCFNANEQELIDVIIKIALRFDIRYKIIDRQTWKVIQLYSFPFGTWLKYIFGREAAKKVVPNFIYNQSVAFIKKFIEATFDGDGHVGKTMASIQLATKSAIKDLRMLLQMFDIFPSISKSSKRGKNYWRLDISMGQWLEFKKPSFEDKINHVRVNIRGKNFIRIREIRTMPYTGFVYNMDVEDDHSYTSDFVAAHNCLSSVECQYAGTPLITSNLGALATTVNPHYNVLIDGDPYGKAYQQRFISAAVALLKNRPQLDAMAMSCRLFAQVEFKGWDAIADTWLNEVWRL